MSPYEKRCQGRVVAHLGARTLARDCFNCLRRTDVPAAVQNSPWMQPPVMGVSGVCSGKVAAAAVVAEMAHGSNE